MDKVSDKERTSQEGNENKIPVGMKGMIDSDHDPGRQGERHVKAGKNPGKSREDKGD